MEDRVERRTLIPELERLFHRVNRTSLDRFALGQKSTRDGKHNKVQYLRPNKLRSNQTGGERTCLMVPVNPWTPRHQIRDTFLSY